jgi:hypothetical protein
MLEKIEIQHELDFSELTQRLRNVRLRGFPETKIYEDANIEIKKVSSDWIKSNLFIPQPSVYRKGFLDRMDRVRELFMEQGIDISKLEGGVDYVAIDNQGEETMWTMIPPAVEIVRINVNSEGELDYSNLIGEELKRKMEEGGYQLNEELGYLSFEEYKNLPAKSSISLVCDGSHRIHSALEKTAKQNLLLIDGPKQGFPYYAAPKPYSSVHVIEERPDGGANDKTHILTSPGHKLLYRLYPSGGINSGTLRISSEKID